MMEDLWKLFPRLLEQKINGLLDEAGPNQTKAFQLYKTCKHEDLWQDSFEKFSQEMSAFFSLPKSKRRKSHLDTFLNRPMDMRTFEDFDIDFRGADVALNSISEVTSWAHHSMRVNYKTNSVVISVDVLNRAFQHIINPPLFEKARNIEFDDFCGAWKKTVFKLFGRKHDAEFNLILKELKWLDLQLKQAEKNPTENTFYPTIYLTQTEIDWTNDTLKAVTEHQEAPKFPLSRGPDKPRLEELERLIQLYNLVQASKIPELLKHREKIRSTILERCSILLKERAR